MPQTTILDLACAPPAARGRTLRFVIAGLVGLLIGVLGAMNDGRHYADPNWPPFNGILFLPALYVAIAIHELGHAAAGSFAGFELGALRVGGFFWFRAGDH